MQKNINFRTYFAPFLFNFGKSFSTFIGMKKILILVVAVVSLSACNSQKNLNNSETLPKDISLKPETKYGATEEEILAKEAEDLRKLRISIDSIVVSKNCINTEEWRISPVGSKPCGGPAEYLSYHIDTETEIIPKIQEYTKRQAAYNQRAKIFSDCIIQPQPSGLKCENGKSILLYNAQSQ